jgi:hypothetical protein
LLLPIPNFPAALSVFLSVAILLLFPFVGYLTDVSQAEQISAPAQDVFFWNQIIESDQSFLPALVLSNP